MLTANGMKGDAKRGRSFLEDRAAVEAYRQKHGSMSLTRYMLDGVLVMIKAKGQDVVEVVSLPDLVVKAVPRSEFDARAFWIPVDEMPLYTSPSDEVIAGYNKDVEDLWRAASLCL
jgi:hypothetical protein